MSLDLEKRSVNDGPVSVTRFERASWLAENWKSRPERVWLLAIVLLGLALRLVRLGTWSYWHDEAHNLIMSDHVLAVLGGDLVSNHPPLFTLLVAAWRGIGMGENEWTMRLLVVVLGLASVMSVYLVARQLIDTRTGLIAAFLVAISPLHVFHSQDLKEYMVLPVTAPIMVYFLHRAVRENTLRLWVLYGLWAGIACYSELFVAPLLVSINLWFLLQSRRYSDRMMGWFLGNVLGAVLFLPQLGVMFHKASRIMIDSKTWWLPAPTPLSAAFYVKAICFGYSDWEPWFKLAFGLLLALAALGVVVLWGRDRWTALLLVMWFALSIAIVYGISHVTESVFLIRAMLPYALAFYILAAAGVAWLRPAAARVGILFALAGLAATSLVTHYANVYPLKEFPHRPGVHPHFQFKESAEFVLNRWEDGDVVVHAAGSTWLSFYWYGLRAGYPQQTGTTNQEYIDYIYSGNPPTTKRKEFMGWFPSLVQDIVRGRKRVWFVFADWEREHLPYNPMNVWRWLDVNLIELEHRRFRGIEVFLYVPSTEDGAANVVQRNWDDGAAASVELESGGTSTWQVKELPDAGLVPTPAAQRRGNLTLRFAESAGANVDLRKGQSTREVGVVIDNHALAPIACNVDCAAANSSPAPAPIESQNTGNPGRMDLAPNGTTGLTLLVDTDAQWAAVNIRELAPDGKTYRIFKDLRSHD